MTSPAPVLVPVLGDQLSLGLASLRGCAPDSTVVLLMEVWDEATYVRHHQQKIALVFSAMRHFADELRTAGWSVDYVTLDDPGTSGSLTGEVVRAVERHGASRVRVVEAGEWRLAQAMAEWPDKFPCPVEVLEDDRFVCSIGEFARWANGRKQLRMEFFYREMRRKTGLLMDGGEPVGGQWNYDADNRKPPKAGLAFPGRPSFAPDDVTQTVMALVADRFGDHFGRLDTFNWPVTRAEALAAAEVFFTRCLPRFGDYQDAMVDGEDALYHSLLSTSLNLGLLDPLELCRRAEAEYHAGRAPLNAVEGFIRQIIGWREFVRGFYWLHMPGLAEANELAATRPLPEFWWTGDTDMRCLSEAVRNTRDNAYAHHIQRLMVLGNFALIAGIDPLQVQDWFLAVYADAYEWVELPNVGAMSLYADGGALASKPYAASGNYINQMSDHCRRCAYSPAKKTGDGACPFNPLYWHFMVRNRARLEVNPRIGRVFATWDRMDAAKRADYLASAEAFLATLEPARPGWARNP